MLWRPFMVACLRRARSTPALAACLLLLASCVAVRAQHNMPGGHSQRHQPPPSQQTAADPTKTLPAPALMDGIGDSHIKVTTKNEQAQKYFNQGLRLTHCFWDFEALRAFREAARLDSDLAMAHWGIYESIGYNKTLAEEKKQALAKAKELSLKAGDYERRFIAAYVLLEDKEKGSKAFVREMEALIDAYPDDTEARLLLALHLTSGYDSEGRPKENQLYSQAILANLLKTHPESAAANHYWIHAMETSSRPETALESADKLARLAPRSGHIVHMPGHIYNRTGDYKRAHEAFAASARVDEAYMREQRVAPADNWNYAHNVSYLVANLAEAGRYKEGTEWAAKLQLLGAAPRRATNSTTFLIFEGGTTARLHIRFSRYDEVLRDATLPFGIEEKDVSPFTRLYRDGLIAYARGMKFVEESKLAEAEQESDKLDAMLWRHSAEHGARHADDFSGASVPPILTVAALELRGHLRSHQGNYAEAVRLLTRAAEQERKLDYREPPVYTRPVQEVLGEAHLRANKPAEARTAFEAALKARPKSGHALHGLARVYAMEGKHTEARQAYTEFLQSWQMADADLPQVVQAKTWLEKEKLAGTHAR